jgi:hypothetical protein
MNVYCVVLSRLPLPNVPRYPRTTRLYLRAAAADVAVHTVSGENSQYRVIGIEPSDLFAPLLQGDRSGPTPETSHAA